MAQEIFTNTHIHIFNAHCVPNNFLRVVPKKFLRRIAPYLFNLLQTSGGRWLIKQLAKRGFSKSSTQRGMSDKYIAFLNVGLQNSQEEVLKIELESACSFDASARVGVLTMDMDYMDDEKPRMNFETQLQDVMTIKTFYPERFLPFLGVDPRKISGVAGLNWAKKYFENGTRSNGKYHPYFIGLKLYPALGYFPFDARLLELYKYAEENKLPVMTHCTRVGSQYIGKNIEALIPRNLDLIFPTPVNEVMAESKKNCEERIEKYYNKGWIKNSKLGDNDWACDLFGHPENYVPLLELFPELKLCLAHMGGSNEMYSNTKDKELIEIREIDAKLWFDRITELMYNYPNVYTDISYTLSSFSEPNEGDPTQEGEVLTKTKALLNSLDKNGNSLSKRLLFGTDFFMTEQEMREKELFALAKEKLAPWWNLITKENPKNYLNV